MILSSRHKKAVFASLQASRATILKVHEVRDNKEKLWIDEFLEQITKDPSEILQNKAAFEKAVAKATDALGLGRNLTFTTATAYIREELYVYNTDAWNQKYYNRLLLTVLKIFHNENAWAINLHKQKQFIGDWVDTRYVARTTGILEEARVTEFMEDEDH